VARKSNVRVMPSNSQISCGPRVDYVNQLREVAIRAAAHFKQERALLTPAQARMVCPLTDRNAGQAVRVASVSSVPMGIADASAETAAAKRARSTDKIIGYLADLEQKLS